MRTRRTGRQRRRRLQAIVACLVVVAAVATAGAIYLTRGGPIYIPAGCNEAPFAGISNAKPLNAASLAQTPPMGFSSYPSFGTVVNEQQVLSVVNAMSTDGLSKAGYTYVNIDDGWQGPRVNGVLTADSRFPCGMNLIGDYIHAHGLRFGIYTTAGPTSCGGYTGSAGHITTDVDTFASWGVDAIKLDWCSGDFSKAEQITRAWHAAIQHSGRPMLLSINAGGNQYTGAWAHYLANSWRSSDDICPSWFNKTKPHAKGATACYGRRYQSGVFDYLTTSDTQANAPYVGPGHWADPDSLEAGNIGLTFAEAQTQFSIWSMWSAPLIIGADPRRLSTQYLRMLTNPAAIAIDQDPAGIMAHKLPSNPSWQIWVKPLSGGSYAVAVVNLDDSPRTTNLSWAHLGITPAVIHDVWNGDNLPPRGTQTITVPSHGTELLRITQ